MARRFTSARGLLDHLLDRHEDGVAAPMGAPDYDGFPTVEHQDRFLADIDAALRAGAVRLGHGSGRRRDEVTFVRLADPAALYAHLGREPAGDATHRARAEITRGLSLPPAFAAALDDLAGAWSRNKSWARLEPQDVASARLAFRLAAAIAAGDHVGSDYRTFSRGVAGDSKALERLEAAVVRILSTAIDVPPAERPREALAALGLDRFGPPLLIAGPLALSGIALPRALPYLGLPATPSALETLSLIRPPTHLLTIENFASFNRHVLEADPDRQGLTVYTGGYPSRAIQEALGRLARLLPDDAPCFHWSDIDCDGVQIFLTVARALKRPLAPHLMSIELAERHGAPIAADHGRRRGAVPQESPVAPLADYLASPQARAVEQEELDPLLPVDLRRDAPLGPRADC